MSTRRFLHFVFKVADREATIKFYRNILGMKVLRHEEFEEGCKATCNGPYDGKWSKTMIGYGPEDDHFVAELTYNYGIKDYKLGNDFRGLAIISSGVLNRAKKEDLKIVNEEGRYVIEDPGSYKFLIEDDTTDGDSVKKVILSSSNLKKTIDFWNGVLGMEIFSDSNTSVSLGYSLKHNLVFQLAECPIDHAEAYGRIAFSCPKAELASIQAEVEKAGGTILTPLVSLDTPGKTTVDVVILADPDGHEICFVGDEAFRELSRVDPQGDSLLDQAIAADKSKEWFDKKKKAGQ